ncbi:DUF2304 domain-containing protein [Paenibacillus sp. MZ04-78.2]|uniref:DUF2304 domain-containing protein n=1 Tax=Paenibacillus sp. MZ04-78.2 TaxID=2962034 RepID=UPI0020B84887|nr:DUF2304 domain-containing protein [Paenibacillus sp. MZ04-78.2]MCP3774564.1 DUF2304 domain-containing protein [Paenibacillus sp. MZ04-78.2]
MNVYFLSTGFSLLFLIIIIDLVRRQRLKEQYSLLWILFGIALFGLSLNIRIVEKFANILDIKYAPAMLFLFGLLFCFVFILHLTIVISKLTDRVLKLSQTIAIMEQERRNEHD